MQRPLLFCVGLALVLSARVEAEPIRIVTLGDSITKGWRPGVKPEETFSAVLERGLKQQGLIVEVTNAGIGGETAPQGLRRLARDVLSKKPNLVTIMYGTNDSYVDQGKTEVRVSLDEFKKQMTAMLDELKKAEIQAVLMTEPAYPEDGPKNGVGEDCNIRLKPYIEATRELARDRQLPLVDHFAHLMSLRAKEIKVKPWTTDGLHPNPRGHEELGHRILQVVLPLVQRLADRQNGWSESTPFRVQLDSLSRGYDGKMCWVHPRAGAIPGPTPGVVLTMQKLLLTGSDVFYAINDIRTDDLGKSWSPIREHQRDLGRRDEPNGVVVAACDFTPKYHAKSGKLLGIGHTVRYLNNKVMERRRRETCWSVYDDKAKSWTPWTTLVLPDVPKFENAGAGSVQRVDLPDGEILLPIYFRAMDEKFYRVTVLRCAFDGKTLLYKEHGDEIAIDVGRGPGEPSLTRFGNKYYLTLRTDVAGYVCVSDDGLHFSKPKRWEWTDGTELGNYNTQQHWVNHADALYLVYTRKDPKTDHVFRHRAPLYLARVDPERVQVIRETERIAVPERGARLGNFAIVEVNEHETWITVAEWMQTWGPNIIIHPDNPYGADNSVYAARLRWTKPNTTWNHR